jgi:hypothetical protein
METTHENIELMKLLLEEKKLNIEKDKINLINSLIPMCKNIEELDKLLDKAFNNKIINEEFPQLKQEVKESSTSISHIQGPVIQIYHKDDLTKVVKVFNSISDAIRTFNTYQPGDEKPSFTSIKLAFQHKTLYLEHRWNLINRDEPNQNQTREIGETVTTKQRKCGQVAMLNLDKTKIVKVYPLSKDAAADILQHPSAICSAIKYGSVLDNHYWIHLKDLHVSLKEEYEKNKPIPEKTPNIKGIKINVFNVKTNTLMKIFNSYVEINNELNISTKTIKKYMATGETYNGTYKFTFV